MSRLSRHWLWLLLLIPVGFGLARLRFDVDVLNLLPERSPVVQGLKLYQENFSTGQELLITVHSDDRSVSEEAAQTIAKALRSTTNLISQVTWQPPWLENPVEASELVAYLWLNQPPDLFAQLTNRLAGEGLTNTIQEAREQLTSSLSPQEIAMRGYDPLNLTRLPSQVDSTSQSFGSGEGLFASSDGTFRILFVKPAHGLTNYKLTKIWLQTVQQIASETVGKLGFANDIQLNYTGHPAFVTEVANGMERDMRSSIPGTMVIIAILFWVAHRRFLPLLWLIVLLGLVLIGTLAFGGLLFGTLNVVSLGFAAILLGLADSGLILYQLARTTGDPIWKVRNAVAPSILWSSATTAAAFALLNLSGLPGLGQLGSLITIGLLLAAVVMLIAYLPPLRAILAKDGRTSPHPGKKTITANPYRTKNILVITAVLSALTLGILFFDRPTFDHSTDALRPRKSPAYSTLEKIQQELGQAQERLWVIIPGKNESEVESRLGKVESFLQPASTNGLVSSYILATPLWPQSDNQQKNRENVRKIIHAQTDIFEAVTNQGFTTDSLKLAGNVFSTWEFALQSTNTFWPTNVASQWTMSQLTHHNKDEYLALGVVRPTINRGETEFISSKRFAEAWPKEFTQDGIILSGWTVLGSAMFDVVERDLWRIVPLILGLLIVALWLAFRSVKEVLLSFGCLIFSGFFVFAAMALLNQSWNLMNMMAIPLLLGSGVDYSIHIQHAMDRYHGDIRSVQRGVGRALLLCGGTNIAGFGSLVFSSNQGMASLGLICAIGIAANVITAVYLLPTWWTTVKG